MPSATKDVITRSTTIIHTLLPNEFMDSATTSLDKLLTNVEFQFKVLLKLTNLIDFWQTPPLRRQFIH